MIVCVGIVKLVEAIVAFLKVMSWDDEIKQPKLSEYAV
jgi:hypothetical protein